MIRKLIKFVMIPHSGMFVAARCSTVSIALMIPDGRSQTPFFCLSLRMLFKRMGINAILRHLHVKIFYVDVGSLGGAADVPLRNFQTIAKILALEFLHRPLLGDSKGC